jgi:integrase
MAPINQASPIGAHPGHLRCSHPCHLKPAIGALLLCDIDAGRISSYQARRKAEHASARTLNKELQALRQILKRYKLWANLQGDVKFERESDHIGRAMGEEEEARLLAACESNALLRTVVSLALNTALRKNEIRTLRWNQIDLLERRLTVGHTKTEGGSGRIIPLNSVAYTTLVRWAARFPQRSPRSASFRLVRTRGSILRSPSRATSIRRSRSSRGARMLGSG